MLRQLTAWSRWLNLGWDMLLATARLWWARRPRKPRPVSLTVVYTRSEENNHV